MTWVQRIGEIVRTLVVVALEIAAIGTEALKLAAEHLDGFVDDLESRVSKKES